MVPHKKLLNKLEGMGVTVVVLALDMFKNYLTNRTLRVKLGKSHNKKNVLKKRISQGTVLGPALFLIHVNDIVGCPQKSEILSYTDDTVTYM